VGKSGVLEHKSGNISETRGDRGKITMGAYRVAQKKVSYVIIAATRSTFMTFGTCTP